MAFNNTFNNIQMSSDSYTGNVKRALSGTLIGSAVGGALGKVAGKSASDGSAIGAVIGLGASMVMYKPDTVNEQASSDISKVLAAKNTQDAKQSVDSDTNSTEAIQQLFSKSPLTSKDVHAFRNSRHKEFIEQNPFAVRLRSYASGETVAFRVSPDIVEVRNIAYKTLDPVHMPGAIHIYQNTSPRSWNMSGIKLVSRNGVEAEENLSIVNQIRTWQMPFFGETRTAGKDGFTAEMFGAPPEPLEFTAYSNIAEDTVTNIRQIPVVIVTASIQYTNDVDYIKTEKTNQPFPTIITIDLNMVETHSPRDFNRFDILSYKHGKLKGF